MDTRAAIERMYKNQEREMAVARANRIIEKCTLSETGQLVRGVVSRVTCAGCKRPRWNDGTACSHPGKVTTAVLGRVVTQPCGHREVRDLLIEEDGREG